METHNPAALIFNIYVFPSGPGNVTHCNFPAQLSQGGGTAGCHALRGAGQSTHRCWVWTLQQPHGLQHQPPQYGLVLSHFTVCS